VITLTELPHLITAPVKAEKTHLPWLVLGRFGDQRSDKGCLRHKGNLLAITGVESDYDGKVDGGKTSFEEVVERLRGAGVEAVVYTSASHTTAAPRWRVLCPFAREYEPTDRDRFLDRLNGVLGGVLEPESWTLSRAYYFGNVAGKTPVRVETIRGTRLDLLDHLDSGAIGKRGAGKTSRVERRKRGAGRTSRADRRAAPDGLIECDDDPRLIAEAQHRIARAAANGEGATDTGHRTFALAAWLADMRTSDGLILSAGAILDLIMEHWPDACDEDKVRQTVVNALRHRGSERGCELVFSFADPAAGKGFDWDKPGKPKFRPLRGKTLCKKFNEGEIGQRAIALIRQMRARGYTPNQVLDEFTHYPASRIADYYSTGGADLRRDIVRVFSEPAKVPATVKIPHGVFADVAARTFGSCS
jgi:hypothetical protein